MITVKVGDLIKCNTVGDRSSGTIGKLDRICDTEEDKLLGLSPSYGMVGNMSVNLHQCEVMQVTVKISSIVNSDIWGWVFTHYCLMPYMHHDHKYAIQASQEGFSGICQAWQAMGYKVVFENEYPR